MVAGEMSGLRVFVAGATGVLGRASMKAMVAAGHRVTGVARSDEKAELVRSMGGKPVSVDLFDAEAVSGAVRGHEVVCNFATNIPTSFAGYVRRSPWETNSRLHREVSRYLVDASLRAGASRYLQHSVALDYVDSAQRWIDEETPKDHPPHSGDAVEQAEGQAVRFTQGGGAGISLRFGYFYGSDAGSGLKMMLRSARLGFTPLPGRRDAYVSWVHTVDLGTSVVAALGAPAGIYNVVDDEPITRGALGIVLGEALGRRRLRSISRVPLRSYDYIGRSLRVSNARFKDASGWEPSVPSACQGWPETIRSSRAGTHA
jgi:nucleoside-diphosphate-sugar epimerase